MDQRPQEPGPGVPPPWPMPCPRFWVPRSAMCPPRAPPAVPGRRQTPALILSVAAAPLPEVNQDLPGTVIMSPRHNPPLQPGQGGDLSPLGAGSVSCPQGWTDAGHGSSSSWGGQRHPPPNPSPPPPTPLLHRGAAGRDQPVSSPCSQVRGLGTPELLRGDAQPASLTVT